jgi:hypothetical protein
VVAAHEVLDFGRLRFQCLDEEERLVLAPELIVPVIKGMYRWDYRAARREMLYDQRLAEPFRVIAAAARDHDQHRPLPHAHLILGLSRTVKPDRAGKERDGAEDQAADHVRFPVNVEVQAIECHHHDDRDRGPDREPADSL